MKNIFPFILLVITCFGGLYLFDFSKEIKPHNIYNYNRGTKSLIKEYPKNNIFIIEPIDYKTDKYLSFSSNNNYYTTHPTTKDIYLSKTSHAYKSHINYSISSIGNYSLGSYNNKFRKDIGNSNFLSFNSTSVLININGQNSKNIIETENRKISQRRNTKSSFNDGHKHELGENGVCIHCGAKPFMESGEAIGQGNIVWKDTPIDLNLTILLFFITIYLIAIYYMDIKKHGIKKCRVL